MRRAGPPSADIRPRSAQSTDAHDAGQLPASMRPKPTHAREPRSAGQLSADMRPRSARAWDRSDRAIAEWSSAQHGVITLTQLESIGLSPRAVRHRTAAGRLLRLHRGVYATERPTPEGRWLAAVLACGASAVLSHRSAAELWQLCDKSNHDVHVTVPTRAGRSRPGVRVHRATTLVDDETTIRGGIPCTSLDRTLLDLAATFDRRSLERAVDHAEALQVFDLAALAETVERHRGRRGARLLRAVIDGYAGPQLTESVAEERFLALIRSAALPQPQVNASIALADGTTYRPDFLWRGPGLIVEIDGRTYHARRRAFEHDRRRDRRLALEGLETRRYAASELTRSPERVVAEVAAFLHRRAGGSETAAMRPKWAWPRRTPSAGPEAAAIWPQQAQWRADLERWA